MVMNQQQAARKELEEILEEGIGFKIAEWHDLAGSTYMAIRVLLDGTVIITGDEFDWQPTHIWNHLKGEVTHMVTGEVFATTDKDKETITSAITKDDQKDAESKEVLNDD